MRSFDLFKGPKGKGGRMQEAYYKSSLPRIPNHLLTRGKKRGGPMVSLGKECKQGRGKGGTPPLRNLSLHLTKATYAPPFLPEGGGPRVLVAMSMFITVLSLALALQHMF